LGIFRQFALNITASPPSLVPTLGEVDPNEPLIRHADRAIGDEPLPEPLQALRGRAVPRRRGRQAKSEKISS
jgi:hypothetical protein